MIHLHRRCAAILLALLLPAPAFAQDPGFSLVAKGTASAEASAFGGKQADEGQGSVAVQAEGRERAQCTTSPLPSRASAAASARPLETLPATVRYRLEAKTSAKGGTIFSCAVHVVGKPTQAAARARATLGVDIQITRAGTYELSLESPELPPSDLRVSLRKSKGRLVVRKQPYKEPISLQGQAGDRFELTVELEVKAVSSLDSKSQDLATDVAVNLRATGEMPATATGGTPPGPSSAGRSARREGEEQQGGCHRGLHQEESLQGRLAPEDGRHPC